jgi:purine-nucleoside/S-methyl-5'-thioadenosine phosphorylase / adenosine deaminase
MVQPQPSDGFEWTQAVWGRVLRCRPLAEIADHFFTIANLELRDSRDEWNAVGQQIRVGFDRVLLLRQVHGADVAVVNRGEYIQGPRPEADVAVTNDPTIAVGVRVADCAPILIGDRRQHVVGAAHAGWRGTVQRVAKAAVDAMHERFGSHPDDLVAAIGPCLSACCGEVGPEVVETFRQAGHDADSLARWFTSGRGDRLQLDLPLANRDQLATAGVPLSQIHVSGLCTKSFPDVFHSYRVRKEQAGRMVGIIRAHDAGLRAQGA